MLVYQLGNGLCAWVRVRTQSCLTLCDPMDYSLSGSSVHGISQAGILQWAPISSPGDLPDPGLRPASPTLASGFFTVASPGSSLIDFLTLLIIVQLYKEWDRFKQTVLGRWPQQIIEVKNCKIMIKLYMCNLYFCTNNAKYGRINPILLLVIQEKIFLRDGLCRRVLFYFRFLCLIIIKLQMPRISMNLGKQVKWDFSGMSGDGTWQFIKLFYFWIGFKLSLRKVNGKIFSGKTLFPLRIYVWF